MGRCKQLGNIRISKKYNSFLSEKWSRHDFGFTSISCRTNGNNSNRRRKNVLVAYSLGNYISTLKYANADVELILNIQIAKSSDSDKAILQKVDYTPIYVLDNGTKAENRFELTDMKKLAQDYANGDTSRISRKTYDSIISKLEKLQSTVNSK